MAAAEGSAAPSTERNEWGRDARSEVPAQPLEVALRSLELSSRRQDSVESLSESELGLIKAASSGVALSQRGLRRGLGTAKSSRERQGLGRQLQPLCGCFDSLWL